MQKIIHNLRDAVRKNQPLVHCMMGAVSMNFCANGILAAGARPIMAQHPKEAAEIARSADALVWNFSNLTEERMQAIRNSQPIAIAKTIPTVLDLVGIACSGLRRSFATELLEQKTPSLIKGNDSEIYALYQEDYRASGVDSQNDLSAEQMKEIAVILAKKYQTVVLVSGKTDVITDGNRITLCHNGCEQLSQVTATGCLLGGLCGCYLSQGDAYAAAVTGAAVLGISGELSQTNRGNGTFLCNLLDALSTLSEETIQKMLKVEETYFETI